MWDLSPTLTRYDNLTRLDVSKLVIGDYVDETYGLYTLISISRV